MYLKSLTIKGFKSFADTTTLHFEPGITVVVGPNGSGKSNVVDAVAWVLGAQGPRALRSTTMDDVIFAGTASRPALGRAEVHLTVDNTSGMLPIDFTEVTLSRTLFRDGASDYAVNQVPCRLLDIQELLSDSGVGRTQHVVVGQGQLDAVLEARPEERRAVIEEAAGVLKFRRRKEKAARRLAATEANLVRLSDLTREVRRALRPLERQANAAQRHGALVDDLRVLRLHLAGRDLAALAARRGTAEGALARLGDEERRAHGELDRLDSAVAAAQVELRAMGADDLADPLVRVERLREQARGLSAVLAERRRGTESERRAALDQTVVATLEAEAGRLAAELEATGQEVASLVPETERLAEHQAALVAEHGLLDARERSNRERSNRTGAVTALTDAQPRVGPASEVRAELAVLVTAIARDEAEANRGRQRLAALEERSARLAVERAELSDLLAQVRSDHERLGPELEAASQTRAAAETALAAAEADLRGADAERHRWAARADALGVALNDARSRAETERLAGVDEVVGALIDLVEIDEGWQAAFDAAAGAALAVAVVAGGVTGARRCLELLSAGGSGAVLGLGVDRTAPEAPGWGEPVRAHVHARRPDVGPLLDSLVGSSVCVGGAGPGAWREGLEAAVANPGAVVVTLAGDRFAPDGWRVGGGGGDKARGATRSALAEAERRAEASVGAVRTAEARAQQAHAELDRARDGESELGQRLRTQGPALATTADALARVEREAGDIDAEAGEVGAQLAALQATLDRSRCRHAELIVALPALEAEEAGVAERDQELQDERRHLEVRGQAVAARRAEIEARASALGERRAWLQRRLADVDARLAGDRARQAEVGAQRRALAARVVAIDRLADLVAGRLAWLDTALADLRERRRRQVARAESVSDHLDELGRQRIGADEALQRLRQQAARSRLEAQELALRTEAAVEALRRDLDAEPEVAMKTSCPPIPEGATAAGRARDLERELRQLGPINPLALEEAAALRERQELLEGQLDDVKSSRRELGKVIRAVDAEIVEVFVSAFADVAENFHRLFALLFPGGEGYLELTDPNDPLETGIRVRARPSGKNVRSISLLSGGERSLTALAYLFAVFRSRPSPFYVLDEVEAALDDVNLHRFLDLVGEFRREAQLLIVSHQQRTMEVADVLYGVTMAPGGASGVVSERITAAEAS